MALFHIMHVQPPVITATRGQWDVVRLLSYSLESLGHTVTVGVNEAIKEATNIVIGYERLLRNVFPPDVRFVIYQLEQLGTGGGLFTPMMEQILTEAAEVWDYSPRNIKILKEMGVERTKLLPLGYHERLETIRPAKETVDVLFYGIMSDRRRAILDELRPKCRVQGLEYVYGDERDHYIARAKIVLNMHHYATQLGEQVRVSYLLNNKKCVVSEESPDDPLASCCAVVPYQELAARCLKLLGNDVERQGIAEEGYTRFKRQPMAANLAKLL